MKKISFYLMMLFFVPTLIFTSCKDSKTVEPAFDVLTKYLVENHKDIGDIIKYHAPDGSDVKFVVAPPATAADVPAFVENYYIMDIRKANDFAIGHITGAHNVAFGDILTEASNANKRILVVCYTGQTACYATSLLRLYGYPDAQALKWGMSGWSSDFDAWTAKCGDPAQGNSNWSYDAAPQNVKYDKPVLSESSTDGATILKARVEAVVAAGFKTVKGTDVLESPANYFVNNYFSDADYMAFGHIKDAYRINPLTIADDLIYFLDPNQKIVTYCYTGQTSAVITAYLNVLGYDAYSLLFGMNGLYNSNAAWSKNQWGGDSGPKDLPVVSE